MTMKNFPLIFLAILSLVACTEKSQTPAYKDSTLPVNERVQDLLSRMTPEEKFWQMFMIPGDLSDGKEKYKNGIFGLQVSAKGASAGASGQMLNYDNTSVAMATAEKINEIQKFFVEETRLGIPIIPFDEALHGLVRKGATAFPEAIGLAATWDTTLMHQVALAIAEETKSRGIRQILSPVINIARDVRWGRVEETYGEDPLLTTQMALAFVTAFEKNGIITTPKHFVANFGDGGRDSYPIHFNERLLEEIYFPAYKACFEQGGSRSVMMSYNSLDGTPCTANSWLMRQKLKGDWHFPGYVISDAGAVGGANVLHFTSGNYAESTKYAVDAGLDVIFQTSYDHFPLFYEADEEGMISDKIVDEAVSRILKAKFELGLFENPYVDPEKAAQLNGNKVHRQLAKQAALESVVLLKNEHNVLPLSKNVKHIAVIGEDATEARLGGYSGPGNNKVSILQGLRQRAGDTIKINYAPGCGRAEEKYKIVPNKNLVSEYQGKPGNGLKGEYFGNITLSGQPQVVRLDKTINFGWTLFGPDPSLPYDWYSVRWSGQLQAPATGKYKIGIEGNDGYRMYIDGNMVINDWEKRGYGNHLIDYDFLAGKKYDIKIEYFESTGNARFKLVWNYGIDNAWKNQIQQAVNTARTSDLAVIVAGIEEGEFRDRARLNLPGHQEELVRQVAAAGKPVVVIIVGGSAVTMSNWLDQVSGVLDVWYPGEVGGTAVADVLFGDYNPAGRLPITFPVFEGQLPLYYDHKPTGRGDDYMNLTGQPLFPFGYGLSYTDFEYSNLEFDKSEMGPADSTMVHCTVKNIGKTGGDEVVQMYVRDEIASLAQPIIALKGFKRIHLDPGEEKTIDFPIGFEALKMLDRSMNWVVEPGEFRIVIGSSSKDIRLRGILKVQ